MQAPKPAEPASHFDRNNPFHAPLVERRILTSPSSSKRTIHVAFSLEDSGLTYEAGDVLAHNNPAVVEELLTYLPFSASESVTIPKLGQISVQQALTHHLQVTRVTRKMVQAFAEKTSSHTLKALSSSPIAHAGQVHCTVGVVRYRSHNRERGGVASTMLDERVELGGRHPVYIQPNKKFRLPQSGDAPVIMIGPGTGIAPFRGFLHHHQALGHSGKNWLFFGDRSASTDFLYEDELLAMSAAGHLTRLDSAFSRDQEHKLYFQDRMLEHGAEFWRWLNEGRSNLCLRRRLPHGERGPRN